MSKVTAWIDGRFQRVTEPSGWAAMMEYLIPDSLAVEPPKALIRFERDETGQEVEFHQAGGGFVVTFITASGRCDLVWLPSDAEYLDLLTSGRVQAWLYLPA